ncbi:ATP-binding cassette domain-containing protein [Streptomyces sp. NPDC058001]|uniref:ATP-binding cassette domain-containing protein n=1 Tax=Streptomyces sp. NPDC058001 TaxID=3346300 RepID=UPI0036EC521B
MTEVPVIAADGATVTLGDTTLLAPTTFAVMPGEFWCVTGGNGSGKTTLLRAFLGSRSLTAGSCSVLGERASMAKPLHRRLVASLVEPIPVAGLARESARASQAGRMRGQARSTTRSTCTGRSRAG